MTRAELARLRALLKVLASGQNGAPYVQPLADGTADAELRFTGRDWERDPTGQLLVLEEKYWLAIEAYRDLWDWWVRGRVEWVAPEAEEEEVGKTDLEWRRGRLSEPTGSVRKLPEAGAVFQALRALVDNAAASGFFEIVRVSLWFYRSADRPTY